MRLYPLLAAALMTGRAAHAQDAPVASAGSHFKLEVPEGWKMTVSAATQTHVLRPAGDEKTLLTFSYWPARITPAEVPATIAKLRESFLSSAKSEEKKLFKEETLQAIEFKAPAFTGTALQMESNDPPGGIAAVFMMSDGTLVYHGQFNGSAADWKKGFDLLKSAAPKK